MSLTTPRLSAVVLLGTFITACSTEGPVAPPATPTAAIALGASTAAIVAGGTTTVAVSLTRGGGFVGAVTVTASSLPAGVSASSETIAAGSTTATITLSATPGAAAVTGSAVTVTGTGTGVTIAPQALALTVSLAPGASIALSAPSGSIEAGATGTVVVTLTRTGGFAGDVAVAATGLPAGVTVASQTITGAATAATLTIVTTVPAAATAISITATGTGVTIAPQPYGLTVTAPPSPITQIGTDILSSDANFASKMALSANGSRLAVTAFGTANGTTRVYERVGTTWTQVGADIVGETAGDRAGTAVDVNAAGTRIAVGAYLNDGGGAASGHVRVYDLAGGVWTQVGADLDGDAANWGLGWSVALSASGDRLVAGAPGNGSVTGRVKVFELVGGGWTQLGATLTDTHEFGDAVDISSDGSTIAISSPSAAGSSRAGSVQVYRLVGAVWTQVGNTLQGTQVGDNFGDGLSLSSTGTRIAVAAPSDAAGGTSGGGGRGGRVRVFELTGGTWTQFGGDILGTVGLNGEGLGETLALSDDGTRVAASGASQSVTRVFSLVGGSWIQTGANITNDTGAARTEGLALSADGSTVAAGFVNGTPRRARVFSVLP
jgi:hypothetical protein